MESFAKGILLLAQILVGLFEVPGFQHHLIQWENVIGVLVLALGLPGFLPGSQRFLHAALSAVEVKQTQVGFGLILWFRRGPGGAFQVLLGVLQAT